MHHISLILTSTFFTFNIPGVKMRVTRTGILTFRHNAVGGGFFLSGA